MKSSDIIKATRSVTKEWTKQRKAEERGRRRGMRRYSYSDRVHFTRVAEEIIPAAYQHASGDGVYTVSKRQVYYAARQAFLEQTGREITAQYFSQTLLVQFLNEHPLQTVTWKITAEPRGTLTIPNAAHDVTIPCGTLAIDKHLAEEESAGIADPLNSMPEGMDVEWPSLAAGQRYRAVLYIEKEGFHPMLQEAQIAERFNIAILSCKGQSVVAARHFVDEVCRVFGGVLLFVIRDLDKAGFEISMRLTTVSEWARDANRVAYEFQNEINVTDLGLRLADAQKYGLQSETVRFKGRFAADSIATEGERAFLRSNRRIELNAFTAPQFVEWLETKLTEQLGTKPWIPDDDVLDAAYRRALAVAEINPAIATAREEATEKYADATIPKTLLRRLREAMKDGNQQVWDQALYQLVTEKNQG